MGDSDLFEGIDDYLVGLAGGIHDAQKRLNELRFTTDPSQPPTTYFMPKVEFELKMAFELSRGGAGEGAGGAPRRLAGPLARRMKIRPVAAGNAATGALSESAASVIRGSFVAVPVAGGRPPVLLSTRLLGAEEPGRPGVEVSAVDALGKPLEGVEVSFNVDHDRSREFNALDGIGGEPAEGSEMEPGVAVTDADGIAVSSLIVAPAEPAGSHLVVVVDVDGSSEELVFEVQPAE